MFDEFAEDCLQQLPELAGTDWKECRRRLSRLYFASFQIRLNGPELGGSQEAVEKACDYLQRLANAIEQYLFNEPQGYDQDLKRKRSYAFIAAEAIDLWCIFTKLIQPDVFDSIEITYARIESALLYLASDYQINAHCSVAEINGRLFLNIYDCEQRDREVIDYLQKVICALAMGNLNKIPSAPDIDFQQYDALVAARAAAMVRIGNLITFYGEWLTGKREANDVEGGLLHLLEQLKPSLNTYSYTDFADLGHLCTLLIYVIRASTPLSVMHNLPLPELEREASNSYERYLATRASQRPFLWPSAKEYIEQAFPGPHSDAVVVVPTGSGKSFLAELACSQAMQQGWVLYLAPTNALVNQVQRDLKSAFKIYQKVQILSFVGGQEYTSLAGEIINTVPDMTIAVMTPEKCAMALRINPNIFMNCRLCIVDEFHIINDKNRGITLDLCLAQILTMNPETRLLLMSAMVSNGSDVTAWLQSIRNDQHVPLVLVPWRPCRTLRSLLFVDREGSNEASAAARLQFETLPATRVNIEFNAPLGLLGGMCLHWEENGEAEDYVSFPIPSSFKGKVKRGQDRAFWDGWKNIAAVQLSDILYKSGSSVLCFILTSKHHVFSCADRIDFECDVIFDQHTKALIDIANVELGVPSRVGELLRKGVGVHSSAMLDTEQAAVERTFGNRSIKLLFATPTLAQGLNLPADVVVVAGSSLGDPRKSDTMQGVYSPDATILNAFGRAGRAMVANHGLAVLVSDKPFSGPLSEGVNVDAAIQKYRLLSGSDRCVQVSSPIASFVERLTPDAPLDAFTTEELELAAQLGEEREQDTEILGHTFGAYIAHRRQADISIEAAAGRIRDIGARLVQEQNMPEWMPTAAMRGGIDLLTCWRLWRAINDRVQILEDFGTANLQSCLSLFIEVMSRMPPKDIRRILPDNVRAMNTVLDKMLARIGANEYAVDWEIPADWANLWTELSTIIWMYMDGCAYAEMAAFFLAIDMAEVDSRRSQGQAPISAIFSFVGRVLHHLSIYAGALLGILEESNLLNGQLGEMPLLPLCIRNGCNSRDSWAWFRYGYRNRIAAHEFALAFPIPAEIHDDSEIKMWVTQRRREWLDEGVTDQEPVVLRSVRTIMIS